MPTYVNETRKNPSTGKVEKTGRLQAIGKKPRESGGGYETGVIGTTDRPGGTIQDQVAGSTQGSLTDLRLAQEAQAKKAATQVQTQAAPPQTPQQALDAQRNEQNNRILQQINQAANAPKQRERTPSQIQPGPAQVETYEDKLRRERQDPSYSKAEKLLSVPDFTVDTEAALERADQSQFLSGEYLKQKTVAGAFGGFGGLFRVAAAPIKTAKNIGSAVKQFFGGGAPEIAQATIQEATRNPVAFAIEAFVIDKGVGAVGESVRIARVATKTEVPSADIVNPRFSYGIDRYPQRPVTEAGQNSLITDINQQGFAFSGSPERVAGGGDVNVLTQQGKIDAGLDLSESGGLYADARLSPQFTGQVQKDPSYGLGIPKFGSEGSIQLIETKAGRIPRGERSTLVSAQDYLETRAASEQPGVALISPAREFGKTESEVIIPGGSVLKRTDDPSRLQKALGTDFKEFTYVPTKFPEANAPQSGLEFIGPDGTLRRTPPSETFVGQNPTPFTAVPIRRYENVGGRIDAAEGFNGVIPENFDSYRPPSRTETGVLKGAWFPESSSGSGSSGSSPIKPVDLSRSDVPSSSQPSTPPSSVTPVISSGGGSSRRRSSKTPSSSVTPSGSPSSSVIESVDFRSGGGSSPSSNPSRGSGSPSGGSGSGGGSSGGGSSRPPLAVILPKSPLSNLPSGSRVSYRQGYNVQVRRKGVFVQVNRQALTREAAIDLGTYEVGTTSAATFKVTAANEGATEYAAPKGDRRDFVTKPNNVFIERANRRIKSAGEKQEITFKGIAANKGRSKIKSVFGRRK